MNKQIQSDSDKTSEALAALEERLALIYRLCCGTAPKQSVGELVAVMQKMPEWEIVRSACSRCPEFDSQDAPLTDSQILALAGEGREFDMITMKPNNVIAFARALLAQAQVKTESTYSKSQLKMIERAIVGLRDGWATRKDADDALAILASDFAAPVSAPQPKTHLGNDDNSLAGSLDVPTECKSLPEWINVSTNLPKDFVPVIALRKPRRKNMRPTMVVAMYCRPGPQHMDDHASWWEPIGDHEIEVTHWMPLPSAPTEPLYGASTEPRQAPQAKYPKQDLDLCAPLSDKEPT